MGLCVVAVPTLRACMLAPAFSSTSTRLMSPILTATRSGDVVAPFAEGGDASTSMSGAVQSKLTMSRWRFATASDNAVQLSLCW